MPTEQLSPFVYWAQTESSVLLRIDLRDVRSPEVNATGRSFQFVANGWGAMGQNHYTFQLDFFLPIRKDDCHYQVTDRQIDVQIAKESKGWWPRLTARPVKPVWLRIDFDRWKHEEEDEDDEGNTINEFGGDPPRNVLQDYPEAYDKLFREEYGYKVESLRKVYLFLYNLVQCVCFLYASGVLVATLLKDGPEAASTAYESVGGVMKFAHFLMVLEVLHPLLGYTSGSVLSSFMQVFGRCFVLFCMIDAEPRMQTKPVVMYLFAAWCCMEIVRYPYLMMRVYGKQLPLLTWLRYTMWIPLYPIGFICEGIVILRNIPYFEETGRFSISLPNSLNFAFHLPTAMRIYLLFLFCPGIYALMSHMYKQRCKHLGPAAYKRKVA